MNYSQPQSARNRAQAYEDYFVPHVFRPWGEELLDRAKLQPREQVLDLACGTGIVARMVAQGLSGQVRVVAVDLNPAMVEVARSTAEQEGVAIEWHVASADALPFPDASFDLVTIHQGLQFFPDRVTAAREVYRVLAPGGRVATATWTALRDNPFNEAFAELIEQHLGTPAMHTPFSLGDRDALHSLFVEAGFEGIEIERVTRAVRVPSPDTFVDLSVEATSVSVPALQAMEEGERAALIDAVRDDMVALTREYTQGDEVVSVRGINVVLARKAG